MKHKTCLHTKMKFFFWTHVGLPQTRDPIPRGSRAASHKRWHDGEHRGGSPTPACPPESSTPRSETNLFRSSSHVNTRFRSLLHLLAQYEPVSNFQLRPTHDQDADHNLEKIMEPQKFPAFRLKTFLTHDFENYARKHRLSKCRYSRPKRHSLDTTGVADNKASLPSSASIV